MNPRFVILRKSAATFSHGFLALITLAVIGCGPSVEQVGPSASGKVTLDGQPVTSGAVFFSPVTSGSSAAGQIMEDGTFEVDTSALQTGIAPGDYSVYLSAWKEVPESDSGESSDPEPLVPLAYMDSENTILSVTIGPDGNNDIKIELSSDVAAAE
tara:strand:+ start:51253 stop:51720 length:468 start_codon:yes stop_codon:yes gene_type:complete